MARDTKKDVIPPPPKKTTRLNYAPKLDVPPDNLSRPNDDVQDMNFKVHPDFHRRFKITATIWGMSMKELLEASFKAWLEKNDTQPLQQGDIFKG